VRAKAATFALTLALVGACAHAPPRVSEHRPGVSDALDPRGRCERCHAEIYAEWRGSNHAEAFRQPTFQVAYAIEPLPFCVRCHAPGAVAEAPRSPAADVGVGCGSCHRFDGTPTRDTCAGCHEFPFPGTERLLQKTVTEHARAQVRASCTECHMPRTGGPGTPHTDHRVFASRSERLVRAAAVVTAKREGEVVVVTFTRAAVGHAFPTGDVFRRLRVTLASGGETRTVVLGREASGPQERDHRPFVDGRDTATVRVPLDGLGPGVTWRVDYERVAHPTDRRGDGADLDGAILVAQGTL